MAALLRDRTAIPRPPDYAQRVRETLAALARIQIDGAATRHLHPSMAALQLYLLDDQRYRVQYVRDPLQNAQAMAENLRLAAIAVGDLAPDGELTALTNRDRFERHLPHVYAALRHVLLLQLEALRPVPLNTATVERAYDRLGDALRLFQSVDNKLKEWEAELRSGNRQSQVKRDDDIRAIMVIVADEVVRAWRAALPAPSVAQVKKERFETTRGLFTD